MTSIWISSLWLLFAFQILGVCGRYLRSRADPEEDPAVDDLIREMKGDDPVDLLGFIKKEDEKAVEDLLKGMLGENPVDMPGFIETKRICEDSTTFDCQGLGQNPSDWSSQNQEDFGTICEGLERAQRRLRTAEPTTWSAPTENGISPEEAWSRAFSGCAQGTDAGPSNAQIASTVDFTQRIICTPYVHAYPKDPPVIEEASGHEDAKVVVLSRTEIECNPMAPFLDGQSNWNKETSIGTFLSLAPGVESSNPNAKYGYLFVIWTTKAPLLCSIPAILAPRTISSSNHDSVTETLQKEAKAKLEAMGDVEVLGALAFTSAFRIPSYTPKLTDSSMAKIQELTGGSRGKRLTEVGLVRAKKMSGSLNRLVEIKCQHYERLQFSKVEGISCSLHHAHAIDWIVEFFKNEGKVVAESIPVGRPGGSKPKTFTIGKLADLTALENLQDVRKEHWSTLDT